jgi:hypothetical protein
MPHPTGRTLPLSLPRRLICDVVHFAQQVPTVPVQRRMQLAAVAAARTEAQPRPGWCAVLRRGRPAGAAPRVPQLSLSAPV